MIISYQIENSQVVLLIFWTDYAKKNIILIVFCMKGGPFAYLKGK
jgi:hypothetical protein